MATTIYLIRHGESLGNLEKRFLGHSDWDLTEKGKKQAEFAAGYFENIKVDAIYSSDLLRAYNTALPLSKRRGIDIIPDKNLREIFAGDWETVKFDDIATRFSAEWKIWSNAEGDKLRIPNGESIAELLERVYAAIEKIAIENEGKSVVIALHATPIRVFMNKVSGRELCDLSKTPWVANASVSTFSFDGKNFTLEKGDDTAHLGDIKTVLPKGV